MNETHVSLVVDQDVAMAEIVPVSSSTDGVSLVGTACNGEDEVTKLSPRQLDVLRLVAEGMKTREIAADLGVAVKTVEWHRRELMERSGFNSVAELARFAVGLGLVPAL
jgi:DNA-binding CsgD family transcriptional regulator